MKRVVVGLVSLCMAFAVMGCASNASANGSGDQQTAPATTDQSGRVPGSFPAFIKEALRNVPDDVLVGIGVANLANVSQAMTISSTRARADISRQMDTMIQDMVRDYQASSEVDHSAAISFQENITVALSQANLVGARVVEQDRTEDGSVWTVVWLDKASVANEINQAQAAAKLAVPAMASFSAEDRMNEAFDRQAGQDFVANDR